jgi:uncharacterized membrane protein YdbT with pleckstrin-like domain
MEKEPGQNKAHNELDIIVRPCTFFLFLKLFSVHGILWLAIMLLLLFPGLFPRASFDPHPFQLWTMLILMIIGEIFTMVIVARWVSEFYIIKNESLTYRTGVFFKEKRVLLIRQIVEVLLMQNLIGRLCNYGTIMIVTPQSLEGILLRRVENPNKYFRVLRELSLKQQTQEKGKKAMGSVSESTHK